MSGAVDYTPDHQHPAKRSDFYQGAGGRWVPCRVLWAFRSLLRIPVIGGSGLDQRFQKGVRRTDGPPMAQSKIHWAVEVAFIY